MKDLAGLVGRVFGTACVILGLFFLVYSCSRDSVPTIGHRDGMKVFVDPFNKASAPAAVWEGEVLSSVPVDRGIFVSVLKTGDGGSPLVISTNLLTVGDRVGFKVFQLSRGIVSDRKEYVQFISISEPKAE